MAMHLTAWPYHCLPHSYTHHHPSPTCTGHVAAHFTTYTLLPPPSQPHTPHCHTPCSCTGYVSTSLSTTHPALLRILQLYTPHCCPPLVLAPGPTGYGL